MSDFNGFAKCDFKEIVMAYWMEEPMLSPSLYDETRRLIVGDGSDGVPLRKFRYTDETKKTCYEIGHKDFIIPVDAISIY